MDNAVDSEMLRVERKEASRLRTENSALRSQVAILQGQLAQARAWIQQQQQQQQIGRAHV